MGSTPLRSYSLVGVCSYDLLRALRANYPTSAPKVRNGYPPPPSKNQRPQPQIGVSARSTELVALRLFPVIAI